MTNTLLFPKEKTTKKETERHFYNSTFRVKPGKSLEQKKPLKSSSSLRCKTKLQCKQKTAKKLKGTYWSVFTKDMDTCIITGVTYAIHPHHIFGAALKTFSETYGFIIPLTMNMHEGNKNSIHENRELELFWKRKCEDFWIHQLHKTKEEWLQEAGKWWYR